MVKFVMDKAGKTVIGLGLSEGNLTRLKEGRPIVVKMRDLNLPWDGEILIMYGATEQAIVNELNSLQRDYV